MYTLVYSMFITKSLARQFTFSRIWHKTRSNDIVNICFSSKWLSWRANRDLSVAKTTSRLSNNQFDRFRLMNFPSPMFIRDSAHWYICLLQLYQIGILPPFWQRAILVAYRSNTKLNNKSLIIDLEPLAPIIAYHALCLAEIGKGISKCRPLVTCV